MIEEPSTLAWYEDFHQLQQKRLKLGVTVERLARLIGRHHSYIEEVEAGRVPLVWEDGGETLWSHLLEVELAKRSESRQVNEDE